MHDKAFWKAVADADYAVPAGETLAALTDELLGYLDSPDEALRDGVAYMTMARWAERGVWSADDFRRVAAHAMADMPRGIGEAGDGVLLRSFSALTLSLAAYGDWKHPWSTPDEYDAMARAACDYLTAETDLRGHEPDLGWLHATAHTADVLKFLARSRHAQAAHLAQMLDAIAVRLTTATSRVFIHGEDERLAMATMDAIKREMLSRERLAAFIERLLTVLDHPADGAFDPAVHAAYMNVKHFLRALYFRLAFAQPAPDGAHDLGQRTFDALKRFAV